MLDIEELAGSIGISEVASVTPKVIASAFEEIIHKKCVWAQLYKVNRDILDKPGKEVVFPGAIAAGGFTIETNQGDLEKKDIREKDATVGLEKYNASTIKTYKIAGYLDVTREAIKFSMRDVIKDEIFETGLQYKDMVDDVAYNQLMFGSNAAGSQSALEVAIETAVGSLSKNVIEINSIVPSSAKNSISAIDYCDGSIYPKGTTFGVAATIYFTEGTKPGLCRSAARGSGSVTTGVTAWGILDGKAAMIAQGRDPDVVVMSFNDIPNLLYDTKVNFLDASAYSTNEPLMNAEVGKLWGLKVITESRHLPQGCAVLVDTDRMGYDVHKEELRSYRDDVYEKDAVSYYFYAERGFGVKDTLALCKVVGGTPDYPATHPVS